MYCTACPRPCLIAWLFRENLISVLSELNWNLLIFFQLINLIKIFVCFFFFNFALCCCQKKINNICLDIDIFSQVSWSAYYVPKLDTQVECLWTDSATDFWYRSTVFLNTRLPVLFANVDFLDYTSLSQAELMATMRC